MRTENVRVKNSTITLDAKVQGCIVGSFRDLSSFAENMPNMKQEGGLVVSLGDLDKGNKKKDRREGGSAPDEKTPIMKTRRRRALKDEATPSAEDEATPSADGTARPPTRDRRA